MGGEYEAVERFLTHAQMAELMSRVRVDRLYGLPGAERMHSTPELVLDEWLDENRVRDGALPPPIEEWDVVPPRGHLPTADRLLEWIHEWACECGEVDEYWCAGMARVVARADVSTAADTLLDLIASKTGYRMAGNLLRELPVTCDPDGTWRIDGRVAQEWA